MLPLLVLAILGRGECYGYDLARQLEAAGLGTLKGGTLYPVLARLERDGLVDIRWSEAAGGPARKYYRLTAAGHDQLERGAAAGPGASARRWRRPGIAGEPLAPPRSSPGCRELCDGPATDGGRRVGAGELVPYLIDRFTCYPPIRRSS